MALAKISFRNECNELLQDMEASLLQLENDLDNEDAINAVFRAAHTIKGTAGIFGFDDIVEFTHVVESTLDQVRNGRLKITSNLIAVLLSSGDQMNDLIDIVTASDDESFICIDQKSQDLIAKLNVFLGKDPEILVSETKQQIEEIRVPEITDMPNADISTKDNWHISVRFDKEVLRHGMDPISFLRYLKKIGEMLSISTIHDSFPDSKTMDPECCYLGFEVTFHANPDIKKEDIEEVFEFVKDDCSLKIIPPNSHISKYIELIFDLPEEEMKLGEILVASEVITRKELNDALQAQRQEEVSGFIKPLGEILIEDGTTDKSVVKAAIKKQDVVRKKQAAEKHFIRVDATKLDNLINLVGELVIANAGSYLIAQKSNHEPLIEANLTTSRLVEEIRDNALNLRMVQIGETFNRFHRVVRDVSKDIGKDIKLSITGADTELDKTVVEKIADPLMHLVRNALDHGIEKPAERLEQRKSEFGTVSLNAYHESGSIVIEVIDDGRGLDKNKILEKAMSKGLLHNNHSLTEQEIFRLIFEPGFSTAAEVTNLSGRGVGMDVVKKNIEALRGIVDIESTLAEGSTIRIRLPLTLAIIDGFLVNVGNASYVIPLDMVVECVELTDEQIDSSQTHDYISLRGEVLPFIRLTDMFNVTHKAKIRESIVVVQYAGQKAGLVVDELLGEFQTVIKPLGDLFQQVRGISGATILGSGEVAVILDVPELVNQAVNIEAHHIHNLSIQKFNPLIVH